MPVTGALQKYQSCQRYSSWIFSIGAAAGPISATFSWSAVSTRFFHCSA